MDFLFNSIFGWLGIGGVVIAAALAVAWFIPPLRKLALTVAAFAAGVLAIYAKGSSDARRAERERQAAAEKRAVESGKRDRTTAERDAAGGMRDGFDTDDK